MYVCIPRCEVVDFLVVLKFNTKYFNGNNYFYFILFQLLACNTILISKWLWVCEQADILFVIKAAPTELKESVKKVVKTVKKM